MSLDALIWALKQNPGKAPDKAVLISLSDRADEDFCCWPSIQRLENDTLLNRKTIISALDRLQVNGFIADTGQRRGSTGKVKVYQLIGCLSREDDFNSTKNGTIKNAGKCSTEKKRNSTKNGTVKQSQKRDDSNNLIVPNLPSNSTENGTLNSTENGTQNLPIELHNERLGGAHESSTENNDSNAPPGFCETSIPKWLDPELWERWCQYRLNRINKAWDDLEQATCIGELGKANDRGQDLTEVVANAMRLHWAYPYPLKHAKRGSDVPIEKIVELYNEICHPAGMLLCTEVTPDRERWITKRVRENGMELDDWETLFRFAASKPHLTGKAQPGNGYDQPFKAQIDHLVNNKGFTRLDEELQTEGC